jgi:hypothetical protein
VARACGENAKQPSRSEMMRRNARKGERFIELFNGRVFVFINELCEITAEACKTENRNSLIDLLNDVQRHHEMNLPNSMMRQPFSAV